MTETIKVRAATGLQVPMAGTPHEYITDQEAVEVPNAAYYLRCIHYGDLVIVEDNPKGNKS